MTIDAFLSFAVIKERMKQALNLPRHGSNRGYDPKDIIESFWVSIWIGAIRFTHSSW